MQKNDVHDGRQYLNSSERGLGNRERAEGKEVAEFIYEGEMPPPMFLITHLEARLTDAEKQQLAQGQQTIGGGGGVEQQEADFDED